MQKSLIYLFFFVVVGKCFAQIQQDKVLHFVGGNLFGLVGAGVANEISKGDRTWTFVGSVGGSLLIGLAKESIDKNQYDGWDNADLLATVLGGITVGATIDIFKQKKKRKQKQLFQDAIGYRINYETGISMDPQKLTSLYVLGISESVLKRP